MILIIDSLVEKLNSTEIPMVQSFMKYYRDLVEYERSKGGMKYTCIQPTPKVIDHVGPMVMTILSFVLIGLVFIGTTLDGIVFF